VRSENPPTTPLIVPDFPGVEEMAADFASISASGRYSNFGPFEGRFAAGLAETVGAGTTAVTIANATAGLHAAILAVAGMARGEEYVVVPSFTFAAVAQAVVLAGFRPLFVDIGDDLQADPSDARVAIDATPGRVRGAVVANSFGIGGRQLAEWEALTTELGIPLVVDSAAGFGSRYPDGTPLGARGDCEVFSFHATKVLAIGEGGGVLTTDPDLAERVRRVSNFGFDEAGLVATSGFNGKLAELPAAIGVRQLGRLPALVAGRRDVLALYRAALPERVFPEGVERSALAFLPLRLDPGVDVGAAVLRLAASGVEARRYYRPALHRHPAFRVAARDLPVTDDAAERMISLPCHPGVTPEVVARVVEVIGT
jgi:dTDP-4-amino-4,6-dideoxygalactose transaminase